MTSAVHHPTDAQWEDEAERYGHGWIEEPTRRKAIELELSRQSIEIAARGTSVVAIDQFLENVEKIAQYLANGPADGGTGESIDL